MTAERCEPEELSVPCQLIPPVTACNSSLESLLFFHLESQDRILQETDLSLCFLHQGTQYLTPRWWYKGKMLCVPCYSSWHLLKIKFELYFQRKILSLVKLTVKLPPGSCKVFTFMQYRSYEGNKQTNRNEICKTKKKARNLAFPLRVQRTCPVGTNSQNILSLSDQLEGYLFIPYTTAHIPFLLTVKGAESHFPLISESNGHFGFPTGPRQHCPGSFTRRYHSWVV